MTLSLNSTTTLHHEAVLEQDTAARRPALYLVAETVAPQVRAPRATPFRLRSYLPNAYLSQSRGRRAGSYA